MHTNCHKYFKSVPENDLMQASGGAPRSLRAATWICDLVMKALQTGVVDNGETGDSLTVR
jgi:hypothetical protein